MDTIKFNGFVKNSRDAHQLGRKYFKSIIFNFQGFSKNSRKRSSIFLLLKKKIKIINIPFVLLGSAVPAYD